MNHAAAPRADTAARLTGESSLPSDGRETLREALDDAELFQSLVAPFMAEIWPLPDGFASGGDHADGSAGAQASAPARGQAARDLGVWEALVRHLDERVPGLVDGTLEATFELPHLGTVAVQVLAQAKSLDITLRFAQSQAWQLCQRDREVSRERLSQRLGRRVNLILDREKP